MVTGRGHYAGGLLEAPAREVREGVRVRRVRMAGYGRRSRLGRIVDYAVFYAQVAWHTLGGAAPDGTVFLSTPPLLAALGWVGKAVRGRRYGVWSMDLHPEAELAAGMLRPGGLTARVLLWLSNAGYRHADFVVGLGPYMEARILAKGVARERLHTVPVWGAPLAAQPGAATATEWPTSKEPTIRERAEPGGSVCASLGLADRCVVMYSGNAGVVHDFDAILGAMHALRDDPRVYFLFVGGGPRRPEIEAFARDHQLRNFAYLPYADRDQLSDTLAAGDIHLISLRAPFAGISVPGKLYGIMAAARPALFVGPRSCETADTIVTAACGAVIDPSAGSAAERVVDVITAWRDAPEVRRAVGARGYAAYLAGFQPETNCARFAAVLADTWPSAFTAFPDHAAAAPRRPTAVADDESPVGAR